MRCWISKRSLALAAFGALVFSAQSRAALVYLDATQTNTTGPAGAIKPGTNGQADDDMWSERTGFSIGSNFFQSGDGNGENSPEIKTTITGLAPLGAYRVYVHFWDGSGTAPDWNVRAGFAPGVNTLFANPADAPDIGATGGVLASSLTYVANPTPFTEGADRTQYAGLVGIALATGLGSLDVYIDDLPSTNGVNQRTWYDGVSYELVPEPASAAMLVFAVPALAALRRRPVA
jgi:hypothetical protein